MAESTALVFAPGYPLSYHVDLSAYTGSHNRVMHAFRSAGFEPHFYQPDWRQPDPNAWADGMADYVSSIAEDKEVVLAGFSLGALTAVLAADKVSPKGVIACSLSPWFGPSPVYRSHLFPGSEMHEMPERLKAAFCELELPQLECPVQLYAGLRELYTIHMMREQAAEQWPHTQSFTPPTDHNIFDEPYLKAVSANAGSLTQATAY